MSTQPANVDQATRQRRQGMAMMILAVALVPLGDVMSKYLAIWLSPFEITTYRYGFQAVFMLIAVMATRTSLRPARFGLVVCGAAVSATTLIGLIAGFAAMPIATAISIFFVEPLLLTLLSVVLLKESVGWRRYLAIAIGLCGALIVIRPNWTTFGWPVVMPAMAAFSFALVAITIRKLSPVMTGLAIQFWFSFLAALMVGLALVVLAAFGLISFNLPKLPVENLWILPAQGLFSAVTFLLFTEAFRRAEASVLAPFQYLEIVGATLFGFLVFGDFPDAITWLGTAIILASGLYVFRRERRGAPPPDNAAPSP